MINLLPPSERIAMAIAKRNTLLRRYLEFMLLGILLLTLLVIGSYYYLSLQYTNTKKTLELNQQKLAQLEPKQKEAEELSTTVNTIAALFSRDVTFSKMLTQIGQLMPEKTVLTKLELSSADSQAPLNITAQVDSEERAAVLRNNLASSTVFSKANIISITKIGADTQTGTSATSGSTTPAPTNTSGSTSSSTQTLAKDSPYKFAVVIEAYLKPVNGVKK